jgi:hypothetical protein
MSNARVLCVENHPEYMDALKYMLETAGYEVTVDMFTSMSLDAISAAMSRTRSRSWRKRLASPQAINWSGAVSTNRWSA